ncbi:MAG: DegT/DnrJ/EryC1/StrS family aminotransferase [Planctomycetota bacterium]
MKLRKVPFQALGGCFEQDDVDAALKVMQAVVDGGSFFPLPEEADFQKALADHEGASHAVVVNSCGTALDLCMMMLGITAGDEVIVPGQTFVCTATCAAVRKAKVVFADVDPETMCLAPEAVEKKITPQTKAIIPVHFAGLCADVEAFDKISKKHGIPIIYDAAHAVGTKFKGEPIGRFGLASCYSFQSNKNMTTLGEGGAIVTNDADVAEKVRQGKTFGYVYGPQLRVVSVGFNYRMTKLQAAVGISQLAKIDRVIADRQKCFLRMNQLLEGIKNLKLPCNVNSYHACHIYVIQLDTDKLNCSRDEFKKYLLDEYGIGTGMHYPAVWTWEAAEQFEYDNSNCDVTEKMCQSVITLPIFPNTTDDDMQYIAWAIKELISKHKK